MSDFLLKSLSVKNFRSIKGAINVPLDANVVLVHGENGAGKTSLLSAIELALTGKVQSLLRADRSYSSQLLYRGATDGRVSVAVERHGESRDFGSSIHDSGIDSLSNFEDDLAEFFSERAFLPQALLSQLLQIYQESSSSMDSPLAKFVGDLLGLDRLDALESGLQTLKDVRNIRKSSEKWMEIEAEVDSLNVSCENKSNFRTETQAKINALLLELQERLLVLDMDKDASEDSFQELIELALIPTHEKELRSTIGRQRELSAIRQQIEAASTFSQADYASISSEAAEVTSEYELWKSNHLSTIEDLEIRFLSFLPRTSLSGDFLEFWEESLEHLTTEKERIEKRLSAARSDRTDASVDREIVNVSNKQIEIIDEELSTIPSTSENFASLLSELSGYINDEICPICDRDFSEREAGNLTDHVHSKVRLLSASAERLLALGRARNDEETRLRSASKRIDERQARLLPDDEVNSLERRHGDIQAMTLATKKAAQILERGRALRASEVATRRGLSDFQSMNSTLTAARETLQAFASEVGVDLSHSKNSLSDLEIQLSEALSVREQTHQRCASAQTRIRELRNDLLRMVDERRAQDVEIAELEGELKKAKSAFERGQGLRKQASDLRTIVDNVRSGIIRSEFNDRLNHLWRDLFVRLAPDEPFVPAFSVPESSTQRLQPKLITNFRNGGDAGGTPGAMLSAGNLNTAALTLFLALHLSVPKKLPWLILDDPVQSMDDVHISNFAALLRTLSKEHNRQVMIAVHDRQLFEYLRLELSPAFPEDTLLTLEMARSEDQDTNCLAKRISFKTDLTFGQVA
ncbi:AAA family ATPase [Thalassovita taeanensis]|uniref:Exonuclease SbcC n=1 Tax=Thalassovita taeanensis TaxID=657014 RepID=A0A1H9K8H8_9RHOB|nr:AAA family ATPase [Thalassovita taeanensis]SEQ95145.1 exonuclease SbcC [Thalassovita taeanensis]